MTRVDYYHDPEAPEANSLVVGIRQSLCAAKFAALSCVIQSQIVVIAGGSTVHAPSPT